MRFDSEESSYVPGLMDTGQLHQLTETPRRVKKKTIPFGFRAPEVDEDGKDGRHSLGSGKGMQGATSE